MHTTPCNRPLFLTLALAGAALLYPPATEAQTLAQPHAQTQAQADEWTSLPACSIQVAALRGMSTGPEPGSEVRPDTARLQAALDGCASGKAVVLRREHERNSFLIGPIDIPVGVRLLLEPGVVVWAVRDPAAYRAPLAAGTGSEAAFGTPRALITIHNLRTQSSSSLPTGVVGWGTVDGQGSAPLVARSPDGTGQTWADIPVADRPALIEAFGPVALGGLALHDAPGSAVRLNDGAGAELSDLTIAGALRGMVLAGASGAITFVRSTIETTGAAIDAGKATDAGAATASAFPLKIADVQLFAGTGVIAPADNASAASFCVLTWAAGAPPVCIPGRGPAWSGALLLDAGASAAPAWTLSAVVRSTRFPAPALAPEALVHFLAGELLLGAAAPDCGGLAALELPALPAEIAGLHATFGGTSIPLGPRASARPRDTPAALPSSVSLSSGGTRFLARAPLAIGTTVSPQTATGTMQLLDGGQPIGSAPLATGGSASFSVPTLAVGGHLLSAAYSGDALTLPAMSPAVAITVAADPVVLTLAPPPPHTLFGVPVTFAVSASPAAAGGLIVFGEPGAAGTLGSVPLGNGRGTFATAGLAVGSHTVEASYGGDLLDLAATSLPVTLTIDPLPTVTAFGNMPAQLFFGQALATSVSVATPAAATQLATGSVTVSDVAAGALPGTALLSGGAAPFSFAHLAPGHHLLVASYAGDITHSASATPSGASFEVLPAPNSLILAAPSPAPAPGTPFVLRATSVPPTADGTVLFEESLRGTLGLAPLVNGSATLMLPGLPAGSYTISASTDGNARFAASSAVPIPLVVAAGPTSTTLAPPPPTLAFGTPLTLSASVANPPGSALPLPGGTLDFLDGSTPLGFAALLGGSAKMTPPPLPPGRHLLHASFRGDGVHGASDSAAVPFTVTPGLPQVSLTLAEAAVPAGDPIFVNVIVAGLPAGRPPTGDVSVRAGGRLLGAGTLLRSAGGAAYATLTLDSAALGIGSLPLSASFPGDVDYAPGDTGGSPVALRIVPIAVNETLTLSTASVLSGAPTPVSVRVMRSVPSATGPGTPTGAVLFAHDGIPFATVALDPDGTASATLPGLPAGSVQVSATFQPTGFFAAIPSVTAPLTVTYPLALALLPGALDLTRTPAADAALTLYPLSGFSGGVSGGCTSPVARLSCTLELPAGVNGTPTSGTVHLRIVASAITAHGVAPGRALTGVLLSLLLLGPTAFRRGRRVRLRGALLAGLLLTGCGPEGGDFPFGNTSRGAVTVTLQAAGSTETIALPYTLPN